MILDDVRSYRHPWLGVEVRHLATLIAVARARSFRQAASELGYVQSAVSQQIANLERVVGVRLVERRRGHRTVTLTPAGELLLERSVGIIGQLWAARIDLSVTGDAADSTVRLAVACDVAPLLDRLLPVMMDELPGLRLRVIETVDDDDLIARLKLGTADVAIGTPPPDTGLATSTLLSDPFVVMVTPDSPLAASGSVSNVAQLAQERIIVPVSVLADAQLRAAGLRLDRAVHVPLAATVPALVANGLGVGLLPLSQADAGHGELIMLSTAGLVAPRRVLLCWHAARRRTALLESFCAVAAGALDRDAGPERAFSLSRAA
jgi:DNA-binding transcriptional LysR family regulator